jgi:SAM-dependent methyltransferase
MQNAVMPNDAERIIGMYRRHASAWAAARTDQPHDPPVEAAWLDRFRRLLPANPRVLDLGCGTGAPIGGTLVAQRCQLTGVDSSPEMIAICKARLPEQIWHVADMRTLSLGRVFDGILAWNSFFHLCHEDQRRMFAIFRSHAAAGAALLFTSGTHHGVAMGELEGEPLYHASLDSAEYRALLIQNGFNIIAHAVEDPECSGHTIWLSQLEWPE